MNTPSGSPWWRRTWVRVAAGLGIGLIALYGLGTQYFVTHAPHIRYQIMSGYLHRASYAEKGRTYQLVQQFDIDRRCRVASFAFSVPDRLASPVDSGEYAVFLLMNNNGLGDAHDVTVAFTLTGGPRFQPTVLGSVRVDTSRDASGRWVLSMPTLPRDSEAVVAFVAPGIPQLEITANIEQLTVRELGITKSPPRSRGSTWRDAQIHASALGADSLGLLPVAVSACWLCNGPGKFLTVSHLLEQEGSHLSYTGTCGYDGPTRAFPLPSSSPGDTDTVVVRVEANGAKTADIIRGMHAQPKP